MISALPVHRLRWLMCALILCDHALTLAGQPASYWKHPDTVQELNALAAWVMRHGFFAALAGVVVYTLFALALVSYVRGRLAAVLLMMFVLAHFMASAGWLVYRYHCGMSGLYAYAFFVGAVFVYCCRSAASTNA